MNGGLAATLDIHPRRRYTAHKLSLIHILMHGGLSALFVAGLFRFFSFEEPVSSYLAEQVASIASLDFHTALTISTVSAWVVWLLFFMAAWAAIRRAPHKNLSKIRP